MRGKTKSNNKGFSLVELIVVIAIMAVLVGILAPALIKYVDKSRRSTDVKNASEYTSAIQTYASDHEEMAGCTGTIALSNGAAVITTNDAGGSSSATNWLEKAIEDAGFKKEDMGLKSKSWGASGVTIYVTVQSNLQPIFSATNGTNPEYDFAFAASMKEGSDPSSAGSASRGEKD
ncbi:MAG: type II secretion system protein [Lachnospiraceae bacterium]